MVELDAQYDASRFVMEWSVMLTAEPWVRVDRLDLHGLKAGLEGLINSAFLRSSLSILYLLPAFWALLDINANVLQAVSVFNISRGLRAVTTTVLAFHELASLVN